MINSRHGCHDTVVFIYRNKPKTKGKTVTAKMIAKCSAGHIIRGTWDDVAGGWASCSCGRQGLAKMLVAKFSEKKCGVVCQGSTGPSCSCECGGENHGGSKVLAA